MGEVLKVSEFAGLLIIAILQQLFRSGIPFLARNIGQSKMWRLEPLSHEGGVQTVDPTGTYSFVDGDSH